MDGTVADTEVIWEVAEQRTMRWFGSEWTAEDQSYSVGGPLDRVVRYMAVRLSQPATYIARVLITEIETLMYSAPPVWMPGAEYLHGSLRSAGVPVGLVSNSWQVLVSAVTTGLGAEWDVVVTGNDVVRPKPAPDPYLLACEKLGVNPQDAFVVEDSPTGVASGLAAGCRVMAIPHVAPVRAASGLVIVESLKGMDAEAIRRLWP